MTTYPLRQLYYDGKRQNATSHSTFQTVDPATAKPVGEVQAASHADIVYHSCY